MKRIALTLLAGLVLAAACGGSEDHNAQDVMFAEGMIAHHRQAVEMANYAQVQAGSPKVKELAGRIRAAQDPEILTMKAWLTAWNEPEAATGPSGIGMGDMGGAGGGGGGTAETPTGTLTLAQISELRAATGAAFDRLFLTMMVRHHEGGVGMARTELDRGKHQPAKQLARTIVDAQQREIAEMQGLLAGGL